MLAVARGLPAADRDALDEPGCSPGGPGGDLRRRPLRSGRRRSGEATYKWRFQQGGCGTPCVTYIDEQPEPVYGTTVAGPNVTHTWQEPGTYRVELTATDRRRASAR